ncbi:uncharacterized protein BJ171DRAFT_493828 [Polychytrium aggregatum]|uniref:uncharacterized protein n=1 Tax=Polychytrium aggregatum TaxID=110093 RepID=UPI0022FE29D0|nr:uncharacterized protein BJ171DRAFT_493828 [Polychytrium aggregatum]KAI9207183.1 hypothetical protein BJ171DRAFT_493828 [Polychytrium aggregatum]
MSVSAAVWIDIRPHLEPAVGQGTAAVIHTRIYFARAAASLRAVRKPHPHRVVPFAARGAASSRMVPGSVAARPMLDRSRDMRHLRLPNRMGHPASIPYAATRKRIPVSTAAAAHIGLGGFVVRGPSHQSHVVDGLFPGREHRGVLLDDSVLPHDGRDGAARDLHPAPQRPRGSRSESGVAFRCGCCVVFPGHCRDLPAMLHCRSGAASSPHESPGLSQSDRHSPPSHSPTRAKRLSLSSPFCENRADQGVGRSGAGAGAEAGGLC